MKQKYSSLKIFYHMDALEKLHESMSGSGKKMPSPIYIRLKPTNRCNHHCSYCSYGGGDTSFKTANRNQVSRGDMIPWPKLQEIIHDMEEMGVKALTFSGGGEPLTYPHIVEAAQMVRRAGIDLALITNGSLLCDAAAEEFYQAKWVRVSFDSPVPSVYSKLRGVHEQEFHKVLSNIKSFAFHKNTNCTLGINFVVSHQNAAYIYDAVALLANCGVNNIKFSGVLSNSAGYHDAIKETVCDQIQRAKQDYESDSLTIINDYQRNIEDNQFKTLPFHKCYICRLMTSICADSKVYYCFMRAYDSRAEIGDLTNQSFLSLWNSKITQQKLFNLDPSIDCKNQCVYDNRNLVIDDYFNIDMNHVNFI